MKLRPFPLAGHLVLLGSFTIAIVVLWISPVLFAGFPYELSGLLQIAREFGKTGVVPTGNGRLTIVLLWWAHAFIDWHSMTAWTALSAAAAAAALLPWWWSVRRLFTPRIAWFATITLACIPLYWIEAIRIDGYSFAFLFLFLGFALFLQFHPRHPLVAAAAFGLCYGAAVASRDAFIALLPWFVLAYVWCERRRGWRILATTGVACILAYGVFALPLLYNVAGAEGTLLQRLTLLLPSSERSLPGPGHLYPDYYTYEFDREAYDAIIRQRTEEASFLVQQEDAHYRRIFGVSDMGFFSSLLSDSWFFLNSLPSLFLQDTLGGAFMWLFILPGIGYLFLHRKKLLYLQVGLWLSMEFLLRFVLHFGRSHLDDIVWIPALLAGVGMAAIVTALHANWKKIPITTLSVLLVLLVALQLLQTNRKQFARLYAATDVPEAYAASAAADTLSEDAVIAYPRKPQLLFLTDRTHVVLHNETIDRFAGEGRLREPFDHYGVTHIIGYSDERAAKIKRAVPHTQVVPYDERDMQIEVTPFMRYLLHIVR